MVDNILYSIIIPHKNIPDLLQRCLDSIPRRDDVQIIVVDDNSDSEIVDFKNFPGINDPYVEIYFTKKGKGAGYARNVGLEHAKGKWVLFADADDWFLKNISKTMNKYAHSGYDMLVFRTKRVDHIGNDVDNYFDVFFDEAIRKKNYEPIKYKYASVCGKFVKRQIITQNKIRFQEVKYANDVMFSLKTSIVANQIKILEDQIYCVFESENSLTRNNYWQNYYVRTKIALGVCKYLKAIGDKYNYTPILFFFYHNLILSNKLVALYLLPSICHFVGLKRIKSFFVEMLKKDYPKYFK
ncbi:MAG: glycosyltransferase family 2 protein [Bacteroidales bacterium]|nr:glycosyltransferase family 2 protein [Salinivirgaceae bacterium]MBR7035836.1 glycosyltransferase family 2 protein [Bacteroidales bacterium]